MSLADERTLAEHHLADERRQRQPWHKNITPAAWLALAGLTVAIIFTFGIPLGAS